MGTGNASDMVRLWELGKCCVVGVHDNNSDGVDAKGGLVVVIKPRQYTCARSSVREREREREGSRGCTCA